MSDFRLPFAALFGSVLLASCGANGDAGATAGNETQQGFEMKSGEMFDDDSQKIIGRYGATNPMYSNDGSRKSASESTATNQQFTGEFSKREFEGKSYDRKSFWGNKDYAKKVYQGDLDGGRFQNGARESAVSAREGSMASRDANRVFSTGEHATGAAREAGQAGVATNSDAQTDIRREVFQQPEVRDWRNRRGLTVDDTKDMLGR